MKITLDNYKQLNARYERTRGREAISPLTYAMWDYFGYHMHFEPMGEDAVIWGSVDEVGRDMFMLPYCRPEDNNAVIAAQRRFVAEQVGRDIDTILLFGANAYDDRLVKTGHAVRTNYIYDLESMRTFAGSALQRKRNNYNHFFKAYGFRVRLEKLTFELLRRERANVDAFLDATAEDETGERGFLRDFLDIFGTDDFTGTLMYIDDRVAGITVGYRHGDYYEVFVEKCDRSIRGAYQYLLANNLEINAISCRYMDRQDDANVEGIRASKESYKPLQIVERVEMRWK